MAEAQHAKYPDLRLSQHIFHISNPSSSPATQQSSLESLQHGIKEAKMAPLYRHLAHPSDGLLNTSGEGSVQKPPTLKRAASSIITLLATKNPAHNVALPWDEKLYEELKAENEKELEAIQKGEDEAVEKAGETEIQAARSKRAEFWARVGDKVRGMGTWGGSNHTDVILRRKQSQHTRSSSKRPVSLEPRLTSVSPSSA